MPTFYISKQDQDLIHYGVLGMKWGVRRYQNEDGTLTAKGRERYTKGYIKDIKYRDKLALNANNPKVSPYDRQKAIIQLRNRNKQSVEESLKAMSMDKKLELNQLQIEKSKVDQELLNRSRMKNKDFFNDPLYKNNNDFSTKNLDDLYYKFLKKEGYNKLAEDYKKASDKYFDNTEKIKKLTKEYADSLLTDEIKNMPVSKISKNEAYFNRNRTVAEALAAQISAYPLNLVKLAGGIPTNRSGFYIERPKVEREVERIFDPDERISTRSQNSSSNSNSFYLDQRKPFDPDKRI